MQEKVINSIPVHLYIYIYTVYQLNEPQRIYSNCIYTLMLEKP